MVEYFNRLLGARASRSRGMIFAAKMGLDRDVNQLVMFAKQRPIGIAALWFVRDDRDHRRKPFDADLPNMQISHERIAIALDHAANFFRQIRRCRRAIEQDATRIAQKCVSPRKNYAAADDAHDGIKPRPTEEFAAG